MGEETYAEYRARVEGYDDMIGEHYAADLAAAVHYHGDPTVAYPGTSCDGCLANFAADFIAKTQAQSDHFMVPAAADYLACDRTINEERVRLRYEFLRLSIADLHGALAAGGIDRLRHVDDRPKLITALVDLICPREWLDRRMKEVL